jgi:hypothetical protein
MLIALSPAAHAIKSAGSGSTYKPNNQRQKNQQKPGADPNSQSTRQNLAQGIGQFAQLLGF